jgi:hypothetical protein
VQPARSFSQCYDARDVYNTAKARMRPFPVEQLMLRDTLLVEVSAARYKIDRNDTKESRGRKYGWVDWRATLELRSISLIHRDPLISTIESLNGDVEPVRI